MTKHQKLSFVHALDIETTPEALWRALTDGAITQRYWHGRRVDSTWKVGSTVTFWYESGGEEAVSDRGIVLECRPPVRLSYTFHVEFIDELRDAHPSRVSFDLVPVDGKVRLTLTHDEFEPGSKILEACRSGWPVILDSLKSLLETGEPSASDAAAA